MSEPKMVPSAFDRALKFDLHRDPAVVRIALGQALLDAFREGIAAERDRASEIDKAKDAAIEAAQDLLDHLMQHGEPSAETEDELVVALAALATAIERAPATPDAA